MLFCGRASRAGTSVNSSWTGVEVGMLAACHGRERAAHGSAADGVVEADSSAAAAGPPSTTSTQGPEVAARIRPRARVR